MSVDRQSIYVPSSSHTLWGARLTGCQNAKPAISAIPACVGVNIGVGVDTNRLLNDYGGAYNNSDHSSGKNPVNMASMTIESTNCNKPNFQPNSVSPWCIRNSNIDSMPILRKGLIDTPGSHHPGINNHTSVSNTNNNYDTLIHSRQGSINQQVASCWNLNNSNHGSIYSHGDNGAVTESSKMRTVENMHPRTNYLPSCRFPINANLQNIECNVYAAAATTSNVHNSTFPFTKQVAPNVNNTNCTNSSQYYSEDLNNRNFNVGINRGSNNNMNEKQYTCIRNQGSNYTGHRNKQACNDLSINNDFFQPAMRNELEGAATSFEARMEYNNNNNDEKSGRSILGNPECYMRHSSDNYYKCYNQENSVHNAPRTVSCVTGNTGSSSPYANFDNVCGPIACGPNIDRNIISNYNRVVLDQSSNAHNMSRINTAFIQGVHNGRDGIRNSNSSCNATLATYNENNSTKYLLNNRYNNPNSTNYMQSGQSSNNCNYSSGFSMYSYSSSNVCNGTYSVKTEAPDAHGLYNSRNNLNNYSSQLLNRRCTNVGIDQESGNSGYYGIMPPSRSNQISTAFLHNNNPIQHPYHNNQQNNSIKDAREKNIPHPPSIPLHNRFIQGYNCLQLYTNEVKSCYPTTERGLINNIHTQNRLNLNRKQQMDGKRKKRKSRTRKKRQSLNDTIK